MLEFILVLIVILCTVFLIYKKYDTKVVLFLAGIVMLFAAVILGKDLLGDASTGLVWLDPFKVITNVFLKRMGMIGLTIMTLFGYTSYMNKIGANEITILTFTKPLSKVKSKYFLVPIVFLLGNLLSLVVPSASSLGVLLMATLFPILAGSGMTALTAAAIIATTATIMPTPLGADNVVASDLFGIPIMDYVTMNAKVAIPSLLVFAIAHYFWQKFMDKKQSNSSLLKELDENIANEIKTSDRNELPPAWYALFSFLPLLLMIVFGLLVKNVKLDVVTVTLISLVITVIVEVIRKKSFQIVSEDLKDFFAGMGRGFTLVVTLIIAATVFVEGIKALGIISMLLDATSNLSGAVYAYIFGFSGITTLIGIISGSGLSVFYSTVDLIPPIADNIGVNPAAIALPMQLFANLVRSLSPVSAVIVIVSSFIKVNPVEIVKRTAPPAILAMISVLILTILLIL